MDNPEKLAILGTKDEDKQNKNDNTLCVESTIRYTRYLGNGIGNSSKIYYKCASRIQE
jgi:hypothetical protein